MTTLSVRPDRPVDPLTVAVSREIDTITRELSIPYFLAGAMARDILLTCVYGIETGLATRDVDFAVFVPGWEQFELIKAKLLETKRFAPDTRVAHLLHYHNHDKDKGYPVDIIPFGGVEEPPNSIAWPPDRAVVMNVLGYPETLGNVLSVEIEAGLIVPIASIPGLTLLKLFAWNDRHNQTQKDAQDIVILCRNYLDTGNQDRIYEEEITLLESVHFDLALASPRLLGKDVRRMATAATLEQARLLLTDARLTERLVTHMAARFKGAEDGIAMAESILQEFTSGLLEAI